MSETQRLESLERIVTALRTELDDVTDKNQQLKSKLESQTKTLDTFSLTSKDSQLTTSIKHPNLDDQYMDMVNNMTGNLPDFSTCLEGYKKTKLANSKAKGHRNGGWNGYKGTNQSDWYDLDYALITGLGSIDSRLFPILVNDERLDKSKF